MPARAGAVHVATTKRVSKGKTYVTHLLRRSIRQGKTVTHEPWVISIPPDHVIDSVKRSLKGEVLFPQRGLSYLGSRPQSHVEVILMNYSQTGAGATHRRQGLSPARPADRHDRC